MGANMKMLSTLLAKNFWVRKKFWILSIIIEILIPLVFCLVMVYIWGEYGTERYYEDKGLSVRTLTESDIRSSSQYDNFTIRYTSRFNNARDLEGMMKMVEECIGSTTVIWSPDDVSMMDELKKSNNNSDNKPYDLSSSLFMGILFETALMRPPEETFKYKFRISNRILNPMSLYVPPETSQSVVSEFKMQWTSIQICVDRAYINWVTNKKLESTLSIRSMPFPQYRQIRQPFLIANYGLYFLFYVMMMIIYFVESGFVNSEMQSGVNILLSVNGAKPYMNLFSWLLSSAMCFSTPTILISFLLCFSCFPGKETIFAECNFIILWLAVYIQTIQWTSFGYHLSAYSSKPMVGMIFRQLLPLVMIVIDSKITNYEVQHILVYFGIISPNFLLSRMIKEFVAYEVQGEGVTWSNIYKAGDSLSSSQSSLLLLIILSFVGTIFNFLMAVYINAVSPGEYGVARHPFYFLQRKKKLNDEDRRLLASDESNGERKKFEKIPEGRFEPGLQIRGLTKTFVRGIVNKTKNYALQGVSADFYKSQITVLLGHNGAGKSTMMNIWSGMSKASQGITLIDGKNIEDEPDTIGKNVGFCPQKNMVSPDLTVYQHMALFGALKSPEETFNEITANIENILSHVNLTEKIHSLPHELSGGEKRRLCIAIAVIGNSNVLIFDEPTSGIDAENKRQVWDIILKMRGQKTMIISTHDMEEADILGDQVAIMHTGKLRSYGSPMFLKNLYGNGQIEVSLSVLPSCTSSNVLKEIGITANVSSEEHGKIVLIFPVTESLPEILDKLENLKEKLGITGIGVSNITLNQIFEKVTEDEDAGVVFNQEDDFLPFEKDSGFSYFKKTLWGYLMKKKAYIIKNPWRSLMAVILPCFAFIPAIFVFKNASPTIWEYNLGLYSSPTSIVKSDKSSLAEMFMQTVADYGGENTLIITEPEIDVNTALLDSAKNDLKSYNRKFIVSGEFKQNGTEAIAYYSKRANYAIPIAINCLTNTLLKDLTNNRKLKIQMSTESYSTYAEEGLRANVLRYLIPLLFMLLFLRTLSFYVLHAHEESTSGMKQLQFMTGASKISYWLSMFIFDFIQYIFLTLILLGSLMISYSYLGSQIFHMTEIGDFLTLFLSFGMTFLPFVYLISSFNFGSSVTSLIVCLVPSILAIINVIFLFVTLLYKKSAYESFPAAVLSFLTTYIFPLVPHVPFCEACTFFFLPLLEKAEKKSILLLMVNGKVPSLTLNITKLIALFVLYCFLIFTTEFHIFDKILSSMRKKNSDKSATETDRLVEVEKQIVLQEIDKKINKVNDGYNENIFLAHDLKKNYGILNVVEIVKGVSFRVKQGECFGLLGVNGAGKSTTFRMLTGAEIPDEGIMYTKNYGLHNNRTKYLSEMGYCPQHDIIMESLNARDHLYLFARLRGIPETEVKSAVEMWIQKLNLTVCAAQPSRTYSGGNKRRLQIAMAMIGNPSLILMDEPTAGVDPSARKSLWEIVKSSQTHGQSFIYTSHSMGECEYLCNRLSIMIKGQLVCVGAAQELKQRFGGGFNINLILSPSESAREIEQIKYRIESSFVCKKMDENSTFLSFHITDPKTTWTYIYSIMESLKKDFESIEDFTILSSTLEQLFIQFARAAGDENETNL